MWKTRSLLVLIVLVLSALGLVMLASTSSIQGATQYHDAYYFVKRQALGLAVAVVAVLFAGVGSAPLLPSSAMVAVFAISVTVKGRGRGGLPVFLDSL